MEYNVTEVLGVCAVLSGAAIVGFVVGVRYTIGFYRRNPNFHYINAEAEVRAVSIITQLKKLQEDE